MLRLWSAVRLAEDRLCPRCYLPTPLLLALRGFERRLEIERSLVQGTPCDRAADTFGFVGSELLDVLQAVDTAARDDRNLQLARELHRRVDVHAGEHSIASNVGIDDCLHAVVLVLPGEVDDIVACELGPAIGRDFTFAGVEPYDDVPGEGVARVVQETGVLDRGGADDDVGD